MSSNEEDKPLIAGGNDVVIATSAQGAPLEPTVHALLNSEDDAIGEQGMVFMRRCFALLVMQYSSILVIASPFALIQAFQEAIHPFHNWLEAIAIVGIISSLVLAVTKGAIYPFARVSLVSLTLSVALELGLSFAGASWGKYGLIAVGQATTSFAIMLSLFQFPTKSLKWLTFPAAAIICLVLSGLWILVLFETGASIRVAAGVGLGGWAFAMLNLFCFPHVTKQVGPEEYILATLFILCPEALVFLSSSKRHPKEETNAESTDYGTVA